MRWGRYESGSGGVHLQVSERSSERASVSSHVPLPHRTPHPPHPLPVRCALWCLAFLEWLCVCMGGAGEAVPMCRLLQTILRLRACTDAAQWEGGTPAPARYQPHTTLLCTTGIRPRAVPVSCRRAFEIGFLGCSLAVWSGRGQIDIDRVWSVVLQKWVTQQVMVDPPPPPLPSHGHARLCITDSC